MVIASGQAAFSGESSMTWDRKGNINVSLCRSSLSLSLSSSHIPHNSPSLDPLGLIDLPLFVILIRSTISKYPLVHA